MICHHHKNTIRIVRVNDIATDAANHNVYHLNRSLFDARNVPNVCIESLPITEYAASPKPIIVYKSEKFISD